MVKALNPGCDLLLAFDWDQQLGPADVVIRQVDQPAMVPIPAGRATDDAGAPG